VQPVNPKAHGIETSHPSALHSLDHCIYVGCLYLSHLSAPPLAHAMGVVPPSIPPANPPLHQAVAYQLAGARHSGEDKKGVNDGVEKAVRVCAALAGATGKEGIAVNRTTYGWSLSNRAAVLWGVLPNSAYFLSCGPRGE